MTSGWFDTSSTDVQSGGHCLILSKMNMKDDSTQLVFSLVINSTFNWRVIAGKRVLLSSFPPLNSLSQQLDSVSNVISVVQFLESSQICVGNADEKYHPLQVSRKGVFMDSTGILSLVVYIL